jgi:hypothetical protein
VTPREEFRRVKIHTISIKGQDDVDKAPHRLAEDPLDLTMATQVVRKLRFRSAALLGAGLILVFGFFEPFVVEGEAADPGAVWAFLLVGFLCILPAGLVAYPRWSRRVRSLERTGWREGVAEVFTNDGLFGRSELHVTYPSGKTEILMTTRPTALVLPATVANASDVQVWIGGDSTALTVLFGYGPFMVAAKPV